MFARIHFSERTQSACKQLHYIITACIPVDRVCKELSDNFGGALQSDGILGGLRHLRRLYHLNQDAFCQK